MAKLGYCVWMGLLLHYVPDKPCQKMGINTFNIRILGVKALALLVVLASSGLSRAGVTLTQNLGANWIGSPTIMTASSPLTSKEGTWSASGAAPYSLGQSFTAPVSGVLTNIQLYGSGKTTANILLYLYDMGPAIQYASQPSSVVSGSNSVTTVVSGNLFSTNLTITMSAAGNDSVMQLTFSGADTVPLIGGHEYMFTMVSTNSSPMYWDDGSGDPYSGGAAYRQNSFINGGGTTDFSLAVTLINTNPGPTIYDCVVDWNNVHQKVDGFGASSAWRSTWTAAQADMFFSTNSGTGSSIDGKTNFSFTGVGLSLLRSRINPGGSTDENSIMQMAQARGAKVWSTPWTPEPVFKDNDNTNGGNFLSSSYQGYASELAGYVVHMKNIYGINLYAISVQNEPNVSANYESCNWTAQQFHDFVPYLYNTLVASNVASTKIILAEDEHWETNYYATAMADPTAATNVSIVACHNYDGSPPNGTPAALPTYANTNAALWETEVSKLAGNGAFDGSMTDAMYWEGRIHLFMTAANINAWHYWWLISGNPDNEGLTDFNGIPAQRMYVLGQYSRFVRPGYYRIDEGNNNPYAVLVTAYRDAASGNFAIVVGNTNTASTTQSFYLTNFTASSVVPWITSSSQSLANQPAVAVTNSSFSYVIPGMSVVTFVGSSTFTPGIVTQPTNFNGQPGNDVAFTVAAGGSLPLSYQWQDYGTNISNGATGTGSTNYGIGTASLIISNAQIADSGNYTVIITNTYGAVTSSVASLTIAPSAATFSGYQIFTANMSPQVGVGDQLTIVAANADGTTNLNVAGDYVLTFSGLPTASGIPSITGKTGAAINQGQPTTITFNNGVSIAGGSLIATAIGPQTLHVTGTNHTSDTSPGGQPANLTVVAGPTSAYKISTTNPTTQAGTNTLINIYLVDQYGNTVASFTGNKTLAFGGLPAGPNGLPASITDNTGTPQTLGTAETVAFANGAATANLIVHKAGASETLTATDGTLSTGTPGGAAVTLTVSAGPAASLAVTQQPAATANAGVAFAVQPQITVLDADGNRATAYTGIIAAAVTAGGNLNASTVPPGATPSSGMAVFSGLFVTNAGSAVTLTFTSGALTPTNSSAISISAGVATRLAWTTQPGTAVNGKPFGQAPVLQTEDAYGNPSTLGLNATQYVTAYLSSGNGPLIGTTNYNIGTNGGNGTVIFTNLQIGATGSNYQITASALVPALPNSITNLQLWLDASDPGQMTLSGNSVTTWNDKSGNGRNASGGGTAPILATNSILPSTAAGLGRVIRFNGTAATYLNANLSFLLNGTPYTIISMEGRNTNGTTYFLGTQAGSQNQGLQVGYGDNTHFSFRQYLNDLDGNVPAFTTQQFLIGTRILDETGNGRAAGHWIWTNGVYLTNNANISGLSGTGQGVVGRGWSTTPAYQGDIAEILVYNRALSDAEHNQVEQYLQNKWLNAAVLSSATTIPFTVAPVLMANTANYTRSNNVPLQILIGNLLTNAVDAAASPVVLTAVGNSTNGATVMTNSTYVLYTNSNNVNDSFTYAVSDNLGNSAIGNVVITVVGSQTGQGQMAAILGGVATVQFAGMSGNVYITQRSTNLINWVNISTNTAPGNGIFSVTDHFTDLGVPPALPPTTGFYRLIPR